MRAREEGEEERVREGERRWGGKEGRVGLHSREEGKQKRRTRNQDKAEENRVHPVA